MKNILGLDLGTNSIGWAVVKSRTTTGGKEEFCRIEADGSRIIPMDAATLGDFSKGNTKSQTADRTNYRSIRRLYERSKLRRERLLRVLNLMGFLPSHYAEALTRYGKFRDGVECKLAWVKSEDGKYAFLFKDAFREMLAEFSARRPDLVSNGKKIPYDWTLYYLRKKALSEKISKEELAWILLNFNQKRGYYQLRGEEAEDNEKQEVYRSLKVMGVKDTGEKKGKDTWYDVSLEDGSVYRRSSSVPLDCWVGTTKDFIITTDLDSDGNPKPGKSPLMRMPKEDDWTLLKKKTEADIDEKGKTVGTYIYEKLLEDPAIKIRGKLVHTIERKYYKEELGQILETQSRYYEELSSEDLLHQCMLELYPNNERHRAQIKNDFIRFLIDDVLFYQRPLKSKNSLIDDCPYESYTYKDKETGKINQIGIKCIPKSHPLYQEFRLWQFLSNLRIYQREKEEKGKLKMDVDVTSQFIPSVDAKVELFDWLNNQKEITQNAFLKYPKFGLKKNIISQYRWNYSDDEKKKYPCNSTRWEILNRLKKVGISEDYLTKERELALWHLLYSIESKEELQKALGKYARRNHLENGQTFVEEFKKFPPFEKAYGAYSAKAIGKLLTLMRAGKYWSELAIDVETKSRIEHLINGEWDENIRARVREKAMHLTEVSSFQALPLWLACYVVYDRHSEAKRIAKWKAPEDIDTYLKEFKQHSLRNPIVEQVLTETLRTVRDIWKTYGKIDEIHIELGRDLKNPADKRKKMSEQMLENENTNLRIKALLTDFLNPEFEVENVRPYSPSQQDLLRIYEEGALQDKDKAPQDIQDILNKFSQSDIKKRPTHAEVLRYKLWLDQKYRSPYTGAAIPLSKLFTSAYEIEHVIPQSRYFDDSFSNKVICEAEVNKCKGNSLGYEFIKNHHGEIIPLAYGKSVKILSVEDYEELVRKNYTHNLAKKKKLLMDDIPEQFVQRQLNDSRYVSRVIMSLLSNIVREEDEQESLSKYVIPCTGAITDRLKKDWGVYDVWNRIILPRFKRLNELTGSTKFTSVSNGYEIPSVPLELQRGLNKKRIDHRHHAMDAIVIACASRNVVNFLNNSSAANGNGRKDLQTLLCTKKKTGDKGNYKWVINKPWPTFSEDMQNALYQTIVSFKQNIRVINKAMNHYQHYENGKKVYIPQTKGDNWSIRNPMHKETYYGEVNLRMEKEMTLDNLLKDNRLPDIVNKDLKQRIAYMRELGYGAKEMKKYFVENKDTWSDVNLSKIKVYYFTKGTNECYFAVRTKLDTTFEEKKICESITDTGIQQILLRHLRRKGNDAKLAFSPDGIDEMNRNIKELNKGKSHQPIYKVRKYEKADKFRVGKKSGKDSKFVEAAKGTNLFFAIYETEEINKKTGEKETSRKYDTIPLRATIERLKKGLSPVPDDADGNAAKYVLSPNDLVYVPTEEERKVGIDLSKIDRNRIYKVVSANKNQCFFINEIVAYSIVDKYEYTTSNKMERAITGEMIKEVCLPLTVDRLGNIIQIG